MRSSLGSIRRLGKDYYEVSIEGRPADDGKRRRTYKNVRGTRKEAETVLAKMKLEEGKREDRDITVAEYWNIFYEPTLSRLAPSTQASYRNAWEALVEPIFGGSLMGGLKAREIEAKLLTIDKPGSQRNAFKLMRQMYNEAYRDDMIDDNPFSRRIRLKRMERYEPVVLLMDDLPEWLDAIEGSKYEPVLLLMLFCGLRREEACALYWDDVEFADTICYVRVDKTLTEVSGKMHSGTTKTPESKRTVFCSGYPCERLRSLKGRGPLVPDANGNRMSPNKVSHEYKRLIEDKGAKYVPIRNLRNSYATIMQGLGASDSLISKSLGHTNLKVDYDHYFAANAPAHMANARMLGDALDRVVNG